VARRISESCHQTLFTHTAANQFNRGYSSNNLSRKHILTYIGYSVKLRAIFVSKGIILEQVGESKNAQLFIEPLGLLWANAT
jgi:hypothetical protein